MTTVLNNLVQIPADAAPAQVPLMKAITQMFLTQLAKDPQLVSTADSLSKRGRFEPVIGKTGHYMRYSFAFGNGRRVFDAQITKSTDPIQLRAHLTRCMNGVRGVFEEVNPKDYGPRGNPMRVNSMFGR